MIDQRIVRNCWAVFLCVAVHLSIAGTVHAITFASGSMSVNSGPKVYDWMLQDWIDDYFEDGSRDNGTVSSNIVAYFTQCYGGDFLENFDATAALSLETGRDGVAFTNTAAYSASGLGQKSIYGKYHAGAAAAMAVGTSSDAVHNAGVGNKHDLETPQSQGSGRNLGGATSTHVLLWAGKPNTDDWNDIRQIQAAFPTNATTTVTTLASGGTAPAGSMINVNGAATRDELQSALQMIGALMDDGADEQFILFVTDHGNIEYTVLPDLVPSSMSGSEVIIEMNSRVLQGMRSDPDNQPSVMLTAEMGEPIQTELIQLQLNSPMPVSVQLNHPSIVVGTLEQPDGTILDSWTIPLPEALLDYDPMAAISAQSFQIFNFGPDPVQFTHFTLDSGDISKLTLNVPEPSTLALGVLGFLLLGFRKRTC